MKVFTNFLLSAVAPEHFPSTELPEIAFLGRSNVGKSSLINSLVSAKVAKTSNTPGRTQAINFFEIRWPGRPRAQVVFADLPGYGYARVPREISNGWPGFVEPYLTGRSTLSLCLCLVDANIPPQPSDSQMIRYLIQINRPIIVIATKADRAGNRIQASLNALRKAHGVDCVLPYSAKTGLGHDELWKLIRAAGSALNATSESA
jgi:GTP-binding protein